MTKTAIFQSHLYCLMQITVGSEPAFSWFFFHFLQLFRYKIDWKCTKYIRQKNEIFLLQFYTKKSLASNGKLEFLNSRNLLSFCEKLCVKIAVFSLNFERVIDFLKNICKIVPHSCEIMYSPSFFLKFWSIFKLLCKIYEIVSHLCEITFWIHSIFARIS